MFSDGNLQIDRNITRITPNVGILNYIARIFAMETPTDSSLFEYDQQFSSSFLQSKPVNQYLIGSAIIFDFQESLLYCPENPTISEILRKLISLGYFVPQIYSNPNFMNELMKNFNILKEFLPNNLTYKYLKECSFAIGFMLSSISTYYQSLDFGGNSKQFLSDILEIYLYPNLLDEISIPLFFDFFIASFQNFSMEEEFNEKEFSLFMNLMQIIISTLTMDITYNFDYLFLVAKLLLFIGSPKLPISTRIELFKFIISITSKYEEVSIRLADPLYSNPIIDFVYDYISNIKFNVTLEKANPPIVMTKILTIEKITPITTIISEPFFKDEPYKPLTVSEIMVSASLKLPEAPPELEDDKDSIVLITTISNLCHSIRFRNYYLNQIEYMKIFINKPMLNEYPIAPFFLSFWVLRVLISKEKSTFLSECFHQINFFSKMLILSYDKYENDYLRKYITNIILYLSYISTKPGEIISDLLKFFLKKVKMVQLDHRLTNCVAILASINDEAFVNVCQEPEINFAQNISSCLIMYQRINSKVKDEARLNRIVYNRKLLLNLLEKVSLFNSVFTYLCSKEIYYVVIMSHFYDVSTADFAFSQIKRAITLFNANYPCTRYIFKFFTTKLFNSYDTKSFPVSILEKIIDFCIEGFIVHPLPIGQIFSESNFLESLVKFSIEIEATDCIEKLLDLLNHISSSQCDYTPNITIFLKLSPLIKSRKNMSLADFLLKIAFGDDKKMSCTRKIMNPGPLSLLLQVYKDDPEKLSEYLTFIQKCFVFSMFEIVHTNLPSQLILYLSEYRHKTCKDMLFDQTLSFLKEIMTYSISPQDLLSYFQLMTIIPEKTRPFYTIDLLETLIHVFKNQTVSALTFFSINEQSQGIELPVITTDVWNNNFSLIIRIFIIERSGTIFMLSNENEFLNLSFGDDSLLILNGQPLDTTLPMSQWITFSFNYYKAGSYQIVVNDQEIDSDNRKFIFKEDLNDNTIAMQLKCNIEFIRIEKNRQQIYNFNAYSFCQKYAVDKNEVAKVNGSIFHLQQPPKVVLNAIGGVSTIIPLFAQVDLQSSDETINSTSTEKDLNKEENELESNKTNSVESNEEKNIDELNENYDILDEDKIEGNLNETEDKKEENKNVETSKEDKDINNLDEKQDINNLDDDANAANNKKLDNYNIDDEESSISDIKKYSSNNLIETNTNNKKAHLLNTILTLIEEALHNSPQLQSDFCSEEGFRMIGELFSILSVDTFNKEVIMKLFSIFNTITDRNLRKQMIEYIFFNMSTWLYTVDLHNFYFTRLFNMLIDLLKHDLFYESILNVKGMLFLARCYLYSKYDESFCLLKDPKVTIDGKKIAERPAHLRKLRSLFLNFILIISEITFTGDDFLMILYFCFDSSDALFQSLIITLLSSMIKRGNKNLFKYLSQGSCDKFYELFEHLKSPNIILFNAVMALFNSLVSTGLLKFSETQIKTKILKTVRPENFNDALFQKLNISSSSYSFKIPLLLYILSAIPDCKVVQKDFISLMCENEVIEDFENNEHFYYIFLMHCFLSSKYEEILDQLIIEISMLCFKKSDPFSKILWFTEFIEFQVSRDLSPFLRKFFLISLDKLNNGCIQSLNINQISSIVSTLYLYFFRIPSFDTFSNLTLEMTEVALPKLSFIDIFILMNKSATATINYSFGTRSTIENEWLDWEVASKVVDTIAMRSDEQAFIDEYSSIIGAGIETKKHSNSFVLKSQRLIEIFKQQDFGLQTTRDSFSIYLGCISRYYFQNGNNSNIQKKFTSLLTLIFNTFQNQIYNILKLKPSKNINNANIVGMIYETLPSYVEKLSKIEKLTSKKLSEDVKIDMSLYVADDSVFNNIVPSINIPKDRIKEKISLFSTFLKKSSRHSMKKYKQLFQSLSSDNGPWMSPENPPVIHYKLDINSTKRTRLIPNMKFKTHKEASLARDLGSFKDAQAIMKEQIAKMKLESFAGDFSLIDFDDNDSDQLDLNKKKNLNANIDVDKVIIKCQSHLITPKKVHKGYLSLSKEAIIFDSESKFIKLNLNKVKKILLRHYLMDDTAVEIFSTFSRVYFVNFQNDEERLQFLNKVASLKVSNIKYIQRKNEDVKKMAQKVTEKWQKGEISNFKYLMKLNIIAGRSFNDLSQYPVFPWVLNDYKSDTIDLSDPSVYRDLAIPIAAHGEQRLKWMREKMDQSISEETRYLFGAFYSSSAVVIGYLIRMEPFTSLHIQLQSGRFDITDRLFVSIPSSWDSVTSAQMDFRELIPEFFLIPDFLTNVNNFDLGKNVNGEVIGDVKLPPWAKSPREFIEINKQALESVYVSENLHRWLDIIFGPHSRMPLSNEANNVFHPYFYETSLDKAKGLASDESEMMIKLIKEYAACFGICPLQIFDKLPEAKRVEPIYRQISIKDESMKTFIFTDNSQVISASFDQDSVIAVTQDLHFIVMKVDEASALPITSKGRFSVKIPYELKDVVPTVSASKSFAILTVPWSTDFSIFMLEKYNGANVPAFNDISFSSQPISAMATSSHYIAAASNDCTLRTWILKELGSDDKETIINNSNLLANSPSSPSLANMTNTASIETATAEDSIIASSSLNAGKINNSNISLSKQSMTFSQSLSNLPSSSNNNSSLKLTQSSTIIPLQGSSKSNVVLQPIGFLAKHGQPIVFIQISERLNLVFSISRDGFLSCISLSDGRYLHGVELVMSEPSLFAVSKSGYVCVAFNGPDSSIVKILDQNLEKINTVHFDSTIMCWTPCERVGIDYMAIVFKTQDLTVLQLPKLASPQNNRNLKMKIKSITFSRKLAPKLFLGTDNGKIIIIDLM
ncbi:hypothetical protein M9Y10_027349 [Tritrichomonas musculus]|uniref:BEACH domain-containing protein n=1 Tax=Tritrichomonas musculus TaxID=1915356 RepID=A0ABR2H4J4_9EUKA